MAHFVYILRSQKDGKRYIGCTGKVKDRLRRHNLGQVRATKNRAPFLLIYAEEYATQTQAYAREKFLKSWAGRIELGRLLNRRPRGSAPSAGKPDCGQAGLERPACP